MIPTPRLIALSCVPLALALAGQFVAPAIGALAAVDAVLLVLALVDALLATGAVEVERSHAPVWSVGERTAVSLHVRNAGRRTLRLRVQDDAPAAPEGLPAELRLAAGDAAEVGYHVKMEVRGKARFGLVAVRWLSPFGLWERQTTAGASSEVRVYPSFKHLRRHGLAGREADQRLPVRVRRRPGGESEFQRLRHYVPGDPYRHIDWKATARRQHFVVREFGQESNQNIIFLLDCGRMMSMTLGQCTAFDHALDAALSMGHAALRHGDRVGMLVFDHTVRAWLPPQGGRRSGERMIHATYDLFPSGDNSDFGAAFRHLSAVMRRRSLVVLLTAVQDEVSAENAAAVVRAMGTRHLPLCVWLGDPDLTAMIDNPAPDLESWFVRAAAAELVGWRERSLADLRRSGALVVDCPPDQLTGELLGAYLEVKARRLL